MKRLLIITMALLVLLIGCSNQTSHTTMNTTQDNATPDFDYSGKTILTWYSCANVKVENEINIYLSSLGKNYAVKFVYEPAAHDDHYFDSIKQKMENKEQIDILTTGYYDIEYDKFPTAYQYYICSGMFLPLDDYLFSTEVGKKLYNQMPEGYWKALRADGSIYGLSVSGMLGSSPGYYVNKKLADKYGWDISKPISDQIDILKKIEKKENKVMPVYMGADLGSASTVPNQFCLIHGVYYDKSLDAVGRITEDEEWLYGLKQLNTLVNEGLVTTWYNKDDPFETEQEFVDMFCAPADGYLEYGQISDHVGFVQFNDAYLCFDKMKYSIPSMATGVASCSENPDLAFDLLATVNTDVYLNNLLTFDGAEPNENGKMPLENLSSKFQSFFANRMICHKAEYESDNYSEWFTSVLSAEDTPIYWGFMFDVRPVQDIYGKVASCVVSFDFCRKIPFEQLISELDEKLDKAGIDELIAEINRQYDNWKNNTPIGSYNSNLPL